MSEIIKLDTRFQAKNTYGIETLYTQVFGGKNCDVQQVLSDFRKKMLLPGADCFLIKKGDRIVGYFWGYISQNNATIDVDQSAPGLRDILGRWPACYVVDKLIIRSAYCKLSDMQSLINAICYSHCNVQVILKTTLYTTKYYASLICGGNVVLKLPNRVAVMIIRRP